MSAGVGLATVSSAEASAFTTGDVILTHFTDAKGVRGITSLDTSLLSPGESTIVDQLQFGIGKNAYLAPEPGAIFVTDLSTDSSSLQLSQIGVFGARQGYAISFSGAEAAAQGVIVRGVGFNNVYAIPGGSILKGRFTVLCR